MINKAHRLYDVETRNPEDGNWYYYSCTSDASQAFAIRDHLKNEKSTGARVRHVKSGEIVKR